MSGLSVYDLRIGSIVKNHDGVIAPVSAIIDRKIGVPFIIEPKTVYQTTGAFHHVDELWPVPLDEQWLKRLEGDEIPFDKGKAPKGMHRYDFGALSINYFTEDDHGNPLNEYRCMLVSADGKMSLMFRTIKYVHEVQNLCFELTGRFPIPPPIKKGK